MTGLAMSQLIAYKKATMIKVQLHRQHGTDLIYTFSKYNDRRPLLEHLKEELEKNGFELRPRSNKEVMEKLVTTEENRYNQETAQSDLPVITNFKTNGYQAENLPACTIPHRMCGQGFFLDICNDCYLEYERYLKEHNAVDFQDMINESARILREVKEMRQQLDFKYIIVDEYRIFPDRDLIW